MRVADRVPTKRKIETNLYGKKVSMTIADQPMDSPLSAAQANKSISANAIHSFDAAMAQLVVYRAAKQQLPIVSNHDCFACHPANAGQLHELLVWEFGQLHRRRLLEEMREEIQERSGVQLKAPPNHGTLDPMAIGSNPYLFS